MSKTRSDPNAELPCKLPRWKADMLAEKNYALAFNAGIEAAARVARPRPDHDEGTKEGRLRAKIESAVLALSVKYYPDAIERIFKARDVLVTKKKRTLREDARLKSLREKIERLPTGRSPHDQEAMDLIHRMATLIHTHLRPKVDGGGKETSA